MGMVINEWLFLWVWLQRRCGFKGVLTKEGVALWVQIGVCFCVWFKVGVVSRVPLDLAYNFDWGGSL